MAWQYETIHEKLTRLRTTLIQARDELIEDEAKLADRLAEVHAFEAEYEAKVGHLVDQLAHLEEELKEYLRRIQSLRDEAVFGTGYQSVDEQYRRTWEVPRKAKPKPPAKPLPPATEEQIKKVYRSLARRFHPDLASSDDERAYRTDKMQAINDAYAARSMVELMALAEELDDVRAGRQPDSSQTDEEMVKALEAEIARIRRRQREIETELRNIHRRPSVELSLEVKFAHRQGRDLLAEMTRELERKIGRKTAERDMIKAQFDSLDRGRGTIEPP